VIYYASLLRWWHPVMILIRTGHPCLKVGRHREGNYQTPGVVWTRTASAALWFSRELVLIYADDSEQERRRRRRGLILWWRERWWMMEICREVSEGIRDKTISPSLSFLLAAIVGWGIRGDIPTVSYIFLPCVLPLPDRWQYSNRWRLCSYVYKFGFARYATED
jgi:hypothetical protein